MISMPSKPASATRAAAAAKSATMRSMSKSSSAFVNDRCAASRVREGETSGSQSPVKFDERMPRWVAWIITAAPSA
ncbi:Uncharacterised protein [Mycobacteroides abscessus subsp. abscessus]|nr:Uncharacterised protein [Mycobacteroides abscessus subsp. abscessus]